MTRSTSETRRILEAIRDRVDAIAEALCKHETLTQNRIEITISFMFAPTGTVLVWIGLLSVLGGCQSPCGGDEGPPVDMDLVEERDWGGPHGKVTVDQARVVSPEEAKAMLVARTAIESRYSRSEDWRTELRLSAQRKGTGWLVTATPYQHMYGWVRRSIDNIEVEIDADSNARIVSSIKCVINPVLGPPGPSDASASWGK